MSFYRTCPECGAHLDYGEICDCKKETAAPGATNTENSQAHEAPTQVDSTTEPASMSNAELVDLFNELTPEGQRRLLRFCQLLVHSPGFCEEFAVVKVAAGGLDGLDVDGVESLMKKWEAKIVLGEEAAE